MGRVNDLYDLPSQLTDERERLVNAVKAGEIDPADKEAIIEFDQYRDVQEGRKNSTRYSDAKNLRVTATEANIPLVEMSDVSDVTAASVP